MNFLKKLFGGSKPAHTQPKQDPENTKFRYLLNIWGEHPSDENYKAVLNEILNGNSFLLLPSVNENEDTIGWTTAETGKKISLASVYNQDGLKVLGAFSDEHALLEWSKDPIQYTGLPTKDIVEMCKELGIDRIVINSFQKNMYVLERNRSNITSRTIEKESKVLLATPAKPLKKQLIDRLVENFKKVQTIEEAYQYLQVLDGDASIVLGIKLSVDSDNSRAALLNALNNVLEREDLEIPVDMMVLKDGEFFDTVRAMENALFYKR